jgi:flagellin
LRINKAADDAAGLAVSTDLHTEQRSSRMALRNVQDAMEMTLTAEGGLFEITDMLQRMRELAVASSSETLADEERRYLDDEYGELLGEIDRIANSTDFAGKRLLAPKAIDLMFMIDTSDSMGLEIPGFRAEIPTFRDTLVAAGLDVQMGLAGVSHTVDTQDGSTTAIALTGDADAFDSVLATFTKQGVGLMDPYSTMLDQAGVVPLAGDDGPELNHFRSDSQKLILYAADIGQEVSLSGATETSAAGALAAAGFTVHVMTRLALFGGDYDEITTATGGSLQDMNGFGVGFDTMLDNIAQSIISEARPVQRIDVQAGTGSGADSRIQLGFPVDTTTFTLGVQDTDVETVATANAAIDAIDGALKSVGSHFAVLGANYTRLESAANNHEARLSALASAESTIVDADIAVTAAAVTAAQIMQQASIAARAQAAGIHSATIPALIG